MNKIKYIVALALSAPALFAQSTSGTIIDTTALEGDVGTIKSEITSFITGSVGPAVMGIAGAGFLIWLSLKLFRWARRAAS